MKEKPILFSTPMVQAILDGRKTMTRRVVKPRYKKGEWRFEVSTRIATGERSVEIIDEEERETRYYVPYDFGDILWVRETWCRLSALDEKNNIIESSRTYFYRADGEYPVKSGLKVEGNLKWRPSIYMPKEAARIWLKVTDVRVEHLQEISKKDARKEGTPLCLGTSCCGGCDEKCEHMMPIDWFSSLWDSINAKRGYSWDSNPWVWVIEFERIEK